MRFNWQPDKEKDFADYFECSGISVIWQTQITFLLKGAVGGGAEMDQRVVLATETNDRCLQVCGFHLKAEGARNLAVIQIHKQVANVE